MDVLSCLVRTIVGKVVVAAVALVLTAGTVGAATAASAGSEDSGFRKADVALAQTSPARANQTVWAVQANPSAAERTSVAVPPVAPLQATADEDSPNAGALVLAVLGLALWVGARLRRQD